MKGFILYILKIMQNIIECHERLMLRVLRINIYIRVYWVTQEGKKTVLYERIILVGLCLTLWYTQWI